MVATIENMTPGDGVRVDVKSYKPVNLFGCEFVRINIIDPKLLETLEHERSKLPRAVDRWDQTAIGSFVGLSGFMEYSCVQSSS